jgi:hypothetical protein
MNRTLKRPMFRIGGSAGTGITSGLDQPRKQYAQGSGYMDEKIKEIKIAFERYQKMGGTLPYEVFAKEFATENFNSGGRAGYQQGSMPTFQASGVPGFLTSFGLNLLATPPQGNIFQTAGMAAREPFNQLQVSQARSRELQGERDFLRGETDRKIEAADTRLDKELASREKIAGMTKGDERVMMYAEIFKDPATNAPNTIKGKNAVDFFDTKYNELKAEFGELSVSVEPIDATLVQTKSQINNFKKANPDYIGKIYYDVASGTAVKFKKDIESGDLKLVTVTGVADTEGEDLPSPGTKTPPPGLFGQETKPPKKLKEVLPDLRDSEFDESFYQ